MTTPVMTSPTHGHDATVPTVSVIIPTYQRAADVQELLVSLARQTMPPLEIVIVDQSTDDATRQVAAAHAGAGLPIVYWHTGDASLTRAKNLGVRLSRGEFLIFLDDDVVVPPEFVAGLAVPLAACGPEYAGGGAEWTDRPDFSPRVIPSQAFKRLFCLPHIGDGTFMAHGFPRFPGGGDRLVDTCMVSGGISIFRRRLFAEIEFDPQINRYCYLEDSDFCFRVSRRYKLFFNPQVRVWHRNSEEAGGSRREFARRAMRNYAYLFAKNAPSTLRARLTFAWMVLGLILRALHGRVLSHVVGYMVGLGETLRYGPRPA